MINNFKIVQDFAHALDKNLFSEARKFMGPNCRYTFRNEVINGADKILKSYEDNYNSGKKFFDEIIFLSQVEQLSDDEFLIKYTDRVRKGEKWFEHFTQQKVTVEDGKIVQVQHIDLPGEDEKLQKFKKDSIL